MRISIKGTYSIRIMTKVAELAEDKLATVSYLSEATNISEKYLEKLINKLLKAQLLLSFRGANGGYKLAKKASDISVRDILKVTEGNMKTVSCIDDEKNCAMYANCSTVDLWLGLTKVVNDYLESISLADIVSKNITKIKG